MSKPIPIRRVRNPFKAKPDASLEQVADLLDTLEGRNNQPRRSLPAMDSSQTMQALIVRTSKEPCYLCQQPPYGVQIYRIPDLDRGVHHEAMIFYSLCFECKADVGSTGKAEKLIMDYIQFETMKAAAAIN